MTRRSWPELAVEGWHGCLIAIHRLQSRAGDDQHRLCRKIQAPSAGKRRGGCWFHQEAERGGLPPRPLNGIFGNGDPSPAAVANGGIAAFPAGRLWNSAAGGDPW